MKFLKRYLWKSDLGKGPVSGCNLCAREHLRLLPYLGA